MAEDKNEYPKWVGSKEKGNRQLVQNEDEEKKALAAGGDWGETDKKKVEPKSDPKKDK